MTFVSPYPPPPPLAWPLRLNSVGCIIFPLWKFTILSRLALAASTVKLLPGLYHATKFKETFLCVVKLSPVHTCVLSESGNVSLHLSFDKETHRNVKTFINAARSRFF